MVNSQRRTCPALPGPQHPAAIDSTAARVAFGKGEAFSPKVGRRSAMDVLPSARPIDYEHPDYKHFNGLRRGRLVAVGYWATSRRGNAAFVMRCDCGRFVFRLIRKWVAASKSDSCEVCYVKASLQDQTISAVYINRRSSVAKHRKCARLQRRLLAAGFSKEERHLIIDYRLPTDDLVWLRGAVDEITRKGVRHG